MNTILELGALGAGFLAIIVILAIWDAIWKGIGMWKSGRNNQLAWFITIFIFNTVGILPIVYILFFQKKKEEKAEIKEEAKREIKKSRKKK